MNEVFTHERLDVYCCAVDYLVVADKLAAGLQRGRGYLADQLRRSTTSIVLNIAEGAGEFNPREKARFYRFARRSATESAAILHVCAKLELADSEVNREGRKLLLRIVAMLTSLVKSGAGADSGADSGR